MIANLEQSENGTSVYERVACDQLVQRIDEARALLRRDLRGNMQRIRNLLGDTARRVFSVSQLDRVIVCRYLGNRMSEGKSLFLHAWDVLREAGIGKRAAAPRVWAT